jgi:hypothetical protein
MRKICAAPGDSVCYTKCDDGPIAACTRRAHLTKMREAGRGSNAPAQEPEIPGGMYTRGACIDRHRSCRSGQPGWRGMYKRGPRMQWPAHITTALHWAASTGHTIVLSFVQVAMQLSLLWEVDCHACSSRVDPWPVLSIDGFAVVALVACLSCWLLLGYLPVNRVRVCKSSTRTCLWIV